MPIETGNAMPASQAHPTTATRTAPLFDRTFALANMRRTSSASRDRSRYRPLLIFSRMVSRAIGLSMYLQGGKGGVNNPKQ